MRVSRVVTPLVLLLYWPLVLTACSGGKGPKPHYFEEGTSSVNATVEAIDYPTRTVTLKGESGNSLALVVDKRVKNLERIKVGDRVRADYYESVDIRVREPAAPGDGAAAVAHVGDVEEGPPGTFKRQSTITAVVENVDRKKGTVILSGPAGNLHAVRARDRKNLDNVKVGDEVVATYREALAVAIDPIGR